MKSKPNVMEYFKTTHTSYVVNLHFTNNIAVLSGEAATGKTAVFSFIKECMPLNPEFLCLNYLDYPKGVLEI